MALEFWRLSTVLELGSISEERFRQETREKKDKARERILPVLSFCGIKGGGNGVYILWKSIQILWKSVLLQISVVGVSFIKAL